MKILQVYVSYENTAENFADGEAEADAALKIIDAIAAAAFGDRPKNITSIPDCENPDVQEVSIEPLETGAANRG